MIKQMRSVVCLVTAGLVVLAIGAAPRSAEATSVLTLTPSTATVAVGELFWLDLDFAGGDAVGGYQLQLAYDGTLVSNSQTLDGFSTNTNGDVLADQGDVTSGDIVSTPGDVEHSVTRFIHNFTFDGTGSAAAGLLVRFGLVALGPGISTVSVVFDDSLFDGLWDPSYAVNLFDGSPLEATITVRDADVTPVPEPGTLGLLVAGAAALVRSRRRPRDGSRPSVREIDRSARTRVS